MSHSGAATFQKTSGIIAINEDVSPAELTWRSTDGDKTHIIVLNTIDKLQTTPPTSEKMMLRLLGKIDETKKQKDNEGNEVLPKPVTHLFSFNNRTVMDNIKITLQHIISRYKDDDIYEQKRKKEEESGGGARNPSETPPPASLINTTTLDDSLSRGKLLSNLKLQQSLLRENKPLMRIFQEAVINAGLPPNEFWSTRIPMLRAYALSISQKLGPYNVLSTIKPVASSDNKVNVNISREKIMSIFENYPIVKKAYTDNVPKNFKEPEFWARFFSSKLFRKLRGEKIMQHDRGDVIIDRYLTLDQEYDRKDDSALLHPVQKIIDLEGNDQDDPVLKGNKPDFTMQAGSDANGHNDGSVDILKGMNRLSEKMVMSLEREYSKSKLNQEDMDREERSELVLSDLEEEYQEDYAMIHLKNQGERASLETKDSIEKSKEKHKKINKGWIHDQIDSVLLSLGKKLDLTQVSENSAYNNEVNQKVIAAVKTNAKQAKHNNTDTMWGVQGGGKTEEPEAKVQLPPDLLESCRMLHSTCCEFLKHFYLHFYSNKQKKQNMTKKLYKNLKECAEKILGLLDDVQKGDGESMESICKSCLKPVLDSIHLAVRKFEESSQPTGKTTEKIIPQTAA
ncbi:probable RNA polymerase II transcription factor B subunit 1 [Zygosaccharomyces bailii ISA1307]|nr:probable RNA polymerase II transcription factor B subunit 1 [Zygosaccharomyces bailii ISA1307]